MVNCEQTLGAPGDHHRWMVTDPESTLTQQEIVERFRRLFHRDMTLEERRVFFLPDSLEEANNQGA